MIVNPIFILNSANATDTSFQSDPKYPFEKQGKSEAITESGLPLSAVEEYKAEVQHFPLACVVVFGIQIDLSPKIKNQYNYSIESKYVKYLEQSGFRIMPIPFDLDLADKKRIIPLCHGLSVAHDDIDTSEDPLHLIENIFQLLDYLKELYDSDVVIPYYGIGLGYTALIKWTCKYSSKYNDKECLDSETIEGRYKLYSTKFLMDNFKNQIYRSLSVEEYNQKKVRPIYIVSQKNILSKMNYEYNKDINSDYHVLNYIKVDDEYKVATIQHSKYAMVGSVIHHEAPTCLYYKYDKGEGEQLMEAIILSRSFTDWWRQECIRFKKENYMQYQDYTKFNIYNFPLYVNENKGSIYLMK